MGSIRVSLLGPLRESEARAAHWRSFPDRYERPRSLSSSLLDILKCDLVRSSYQTLCSKVHLSGHRRRRVSRFGLRNKVIRRHSSSAKRDNPGPSYKYCGSSHHRQWSKQQASCLACPTSRSITAFETFQRRVSPSWAPWQKLGPRARSKPRQATS